MEQIRTFAINMHVIEPALIEDSGVTGRQYCILKYFISQSWRLKPSLSVFRHFAIPEKHEKVEGNFKAKCNYCPATLSQIQFEGLVISFCRLPHGALSVI